MSSNRHGLGLFAVISTGVALGGCVSATDATTEETDEAAPVATQAQEVRGVVADPYYGGYGPVPDGYVSDPGYVPGYGAPGYAVEGCDAYGNCFSHREWGVGGFGGYGYGRSTAYGSQSGVACDDFGCVYY